ncbi:hypothetical protein FOQG_04686 [Fusarium oxysporum f. sp. raphani 54005]|uniref:Uncharacterized protein n=5 Tax=Fusarium oxysporum species complex TaxID=171631 RepID=X0DK07_FUSOX|nr:hypothetical protein FOVG_04254 [Fusarium oxysporum f. sp. pisi HDV247]EXK94692.1 hypothetical protein FOQG_04686 [Fusarium oxysporum f. sp. raphani 54005]EXL85827.1 hypothetical protein FOPG_02584 [Fusarium oxysporum f. sp. conglutinans race 2 54008]
MSSWLGTGFGNEELRRSAMTPSDQGQEVKRRVGPATAKMGASLTKHEDIAMSE